MKIVFLLGSPDISGGTYVIFEHALKCQKRGIDVTIVTDEIVTDERIKWHKNAKNLKFKKYLDIKDEEFDLAIATWWMTIYFLPRVNAKHHLYFVQSIESNFIKEDRILERKLADATYTLPMPVITEATWIKKYLEENYGSDVTLVKNGIRKDVYTPTGEKYDKKEGTFRVLVEGPVDIFYKNVPKTIELVKKSKADEIWLLTSSDIKEYKGVDKVFSKMSIEECAKIYRSCDVLVKLSYVEGMFGPPLEMFHTGGTAITYKVTGFDEYIVDNYNALVTDIGNEEEVVNLINKLYDDRNLLNTLKKNALKTANEWINWDTSTENFYNAVIKLKDKSYDKNLLIKTIEFNRNVFDLINNMNIGIRRKVGNFLRKYFPSIYTCYRKVRK